jgi:pyridoxine/pyridoxamine 5'-phosphate oxidase
VGEWPRNTRRGRVHGGVRGREVREGEVADRWGSRASESKLANWQSALLG